MSNSNSDSDFSPNEDSSSFGKGSKASARNCIRSVGAVKCKRRKVDNDEDVIVIDDSDDSEFIEISDDEQSEDDTGFIQRLKKRKTSTGAGGLKMRQTVSNDEESDDNGGEEKKEEEENLASSFSSFKFKSEFSQHDCDKYLNDLEKDLKKRAFPLVQIPEHEYITTGRTIKPLKAWSGLWPGLREFLQNTVDHLNLMDPKTGRRRPFLSINAEKDGVNKSSSITFSCQNQVICRFLVKPDELVIEQQYTFPIASRSLDTGVIDTSKVSSSSAGGFGDGFKTAATSLMSFSGGKAFESIKWYFYAVDEETKISWDFHGETKESIATFAKCRTLQVEIKKTKMNKADIERECCSSTDCSSPYVMRQEIKVKGIGTEFLNKAITRFVVFWDLDETSLLSTYSALGTRRTRALGGDFLGPACSQPTLFEGKLGKLRPSAGIYVRGIYVRASKIKGTVMSFYGDRLEVTGRDRNDVDDSCLLTAVTYILKKCSDKCYLKTLLKPLQFGSSNTAEKSSWLLQSPKFIDSIIQEERDFILFSMNISPASIFISSKTTKSKDPFVQWASTFLQANDMPLIPIEKGANKKLFQEVDQYTLTERCVALIKSKQKKAVNKGLTGTRALQRVFEKFFKFLSIGGCKAVFSTDVKIAFIHDTSAYIPEAKVSRELIIRVLNVCQSRFEGVLAEKYSSLLEAVLKIMKPGEDSHFSVEHATKIIDEAKRIQKRSQDFLLTQPTTDNYDNHGVLERKERSKKSKERDHHGHKHGRCDSDSGVCRGDKHDKHKHDISKSCNLLDELIKKAVRKTDIGVPKAAGGGEFTEDNAGPDDCIRPSSQLLSIKVDELYVDGGSGTMMCDRETVKAIEQGTFDRNTAKKIKSLRLALQEAMELIGRSIPSMDALLKRVQVGYDSKNDSYEAFYDGEQIVVNLFSFLATSSSTRKIMFDFVTVVTHELAHALLPEEGHGPAWRNCHMEMIVKVMEGLEA